MDNVIKPQMIRPGDTIRVISPSWFGGETFVPRANRGAELLESLGFRVETGKHAFANRGHVSGTVEERLHDLHAAFADPKVKMVLATIGGTHAADLLPHIDFELIRKNPKIFMGFSDNTILHTAFRVECNLATLYGPGLLTDWAEHPQMPAEALESAMHLMTSTEPLGSIPQPSWWTDEFLDWEAGEDTRRRRERHENSGWIWIRKGHAAGFTIGGCLETMQHLRDTRWWPDFTGAILCIETSEECPSPEAFDIMLGDYARMGVLNQIAGLLVARPYGFDTEEHARFLQYLTERTAPYSFPVVANMDFGHTTPMVTMPLGISVTIDGSVERITITQPFATPSQRHGLTR